MAAASRDRLGDVRSLVIGQMPDYQVDCVLHCGEGRDNVAYEVNGELIVRFSRETDPARRTARLRQEARLLAAVAAISSLPVPEPRFTATEHGCLAYFKIPGVPLLDVARPHWSAHATSIAAVLGQLLAALHAVPIDRVAPLVWWERMTSHWPSGDARPQTST